VLPLFLFNVLGEYLGHLLCTLLGVALLTALVINIRDAEASLVAFSPLEVAAGIRSADEDGRAGEVK
jgi:hypothetical protein